MIMVNNAFHIVIVKAIATVGENEPCTNIVILGYDNLWYPGKS